MNRSRVHVVAAIVAVSLLGACSSPGSPRADGATNSSTTGADDGASTSTSSTTAPGRVEVGRVEVDGGTVSLRNEDGTTVDLVGPTAVPSGATLEVGADGAAHVTVGSAVVVRLGPGSTSSLAVGEDDVDVVLEVLAGSAWWVAPGDDETVLAVRAGLLDARSAGSRGVVGCDDDGCHLGVVDGEVLLADGTALGPFEAVAESAGARTPPAPFPPSALVVVPFLAASSGADVAAGLRASGADGTAVAQTTTASLDGSYSAHLRTTASDREDPSGEGVDRTQTVLTECVDLTCTLVYTTEVRAADGSITNISTPLTFTGDAYRGTLASTSPCSNLRTGATAPDALAYTADTTVTIAAAEVRDGRPVVTALHVTIVERNEVNDAGRAIDCRINLRNDPFVVNSTVEGDALRT